MTVQVSGQEVPAFKTCSLVCGLLVGTSASPLGNLGRDVLRKLKSGLEKGLDTFDSTLEKEFQEKIQEAKNLLEQLISGIFQVVNRLIGVRISKLHILDVTFKVAPDGKGFNVRIPITAEVNVTLVRISKLHILDVTFKVAPDGKGFNVRIPITAEVNPVLGEIVDLVLNLVLQCSVSVKTDEGTGVSEVVVEECRSDQHSISLTVHTSQQSDLSLLGFHCSRILRVCPLVRSLLESLDADYVKNCVGK
ncbi:hypothetical protein Celaphus_00007885, partial [Cervus elaphus hippelaphus]